MVLLSLFFSVSGDVDHIVVTLLHVKLEREVKLMNTVKLCPIVCESL